LPETASYDFIPIRRRVFAEARCAIDSMIHSGAERYEFHFGEVYHPAKTIRMESEVGGHIRTGEFHIEEMVEEQGEVREDRYYLLEMFIGTMRAYCPEGEKLPSPKYP
jgi:hypothetical protein